MRERDLGNLARFVVVSDVHLRVEDTERTRLFLDVLASLEGQGSVFLAGDIFDFIFVAHDYFHFLWNEVFELCERLRAKGTDVYFIEGNHDFGFEHFRSTALERAFSDFGDFSVTFRHPVLGRVEVRHGDDVVCPASYPWFRAVVKSRPLQVACKQAMPGRRLQGIFSRYARVSRRRDEYRELRRSFLDSCLDHHFTRRRQAGVGTDVFILGHIHQEVDYLLGDTRVVAGPDWMRKPTLLKCDAQGILKRDVVR